jgi:hypothetical protein
MFVTENLTPVQAMVELMKGPKARPEQTVRFAKLKHDKDLCPRFRDHLDSILEVYRAYRTDVHDIQGMRDDGVDVLVRFTDDDGTEHKAALQIKSDDEFVQWEKKTLDLPNKLKAQYATAISNVRVEDYFLVLCVDAVHHRKRIRLLCSELKNYQHLTIIEPADALGFYDMTGLDRWIRTTRLLCQRDRILMAATDELDGEFVDVAYFIVTLVCQAFEDELDVGQNRLVSIWHDWTEFAEDSESSGERLGDVLGSLLGAGILKVGGAEYVISVDRLPTAVCGLYFDQKVRSLQVDGDLRGHLALLTGLADRLQPDDEEQDEDAEFNEN